MEFINKLHEKLHNELSALVAERYAMRVKEQNKPEMYSELTSVIDSFTWSRTEEGVLYWNEIHQTVESI